MKLTEFELEVMQLFWLSSPMSAPQVHQEIQKRKNVTYSTVKTIIDRLEKKSALHRSEKHGRTIYYRPSVEQSQLKKPMIKDFINRLFLGKSQPLVAHILKEEELSLEDIEYLEAILKERKIGIK